ncbi:MAG: serine hydrolase [Rhodospirillaceae bacterium]|nr:serine hydrolase [Rhodospirillaceae bacterium]
MKTVALIALAVAVVGSVFYWQNRVYWDRYFAVAALGGSGDTDVYEPTEDVPGAHDGFIAVAPEAERTIPAQTLEVARDYAAKNRSSSLLIWHKGKLQSADYWGGAQDTPVNSRSLHKMLGGLLIGAAIKDGHIASLDDPTAKYIVAWRGTPKEKITIRNVLQMSSGLMWFRGGGPYSLASRRYIDPEWDRLLVENVPLEFPPGSAYDYSDITADVMPHIIEGATKKRYAEYLGDAILKPIGAAGGKIWVNREGGMPHGGCCLMLPPETWLRIGVMVLNYGAVAGREVLPSWWVTEMRKPSRNNPHFGLMTWLGQPYTQRRLFHRPNSPNNAAPRPGAFHSEPYLADDLFLFDGMNGQIVYMVPSQDLVIVRTGLRPPPNQPEWDNSALPNMILRGLGVGGPKATPRQLPPQEPRQRSMRDRISGETRFWTRWLSIQDQTPATLPAWTDVKETVAGSFTVELPTRPESERTIAPEAITAAVDYAEKTKSLSLIVWRDGAVEVEKYWNGRSPDDVSETYSMAKSMLALAVGQAVTDGRIASVDDAAANYIGEWRGTAKETLTIRQLLTMSSGVRHERFNYAFSQSPWATGLRTFLGPDIASYVLNYPIDRVPGGEFNYNSANTQILLTLLERATGKRYADYVSEKLWKPMGAKDAHLWLDRPGGTARAFSYFMARPRDWLRVGVMLANGGRFEGREVASAEWLKAMTTPSRHNPNYGFQVWLGAPAAGKRFYNRNTPVGVTHSAPYLADDVVFFDGGGGHRVYMVPSKKLVIVRTGAVNRPDWDDAILPNAILKGM